MLSSPPFVVTGLAATAYLASHVLRYRRTKALFQEGNAPAMRIAGAHIGSAWLGAVLPFRLGELARVTAFWSVTPRWRVAVAAYGMEKFFDALLLLALIGGSLLWSSANTAPAALAALLATLVTGALAAYAVAEPALERTARALLRAPRTRRSLWMLRAVAEGRDLRNAVEATVRRRGARLFLLTAGIWLCDALAFAMLTPRLDAAVTLDFLDTLQRMLRGTLTQSSTGYGLVVLLVLTALLAGFATVAAWRAFRHRHRPRAFRPYRLSLRSLGRENA